jgi:elongation factor Ts
LANTVAEHVAATAPLAVDKADVPEDVIARERAIYEEQTRASGKPENMIDKIVTGKVEAYYKQVALVFQPWVREEKQTVGDLVKAAAKTVGAPVRIKRFVRFQLGGQ